MKRIYCICFLLLLAFCLTACDFSGTTGGTDGTEPTKPRYEHIHCVCAETAVGVGDHKTCDDKIGWVSVTTNQELTEAMQRATTEKVHIYLENDLVFTSPVAVATDADISICLNGHNLSMNADNYGVLTVTDCTKNPGTWTSNGDGAVRGYAKSVFNLYAITLTVGGTSTQSQVVAITGQGNEIHLLDEDAVYFNMYGGEIYNPNQTSMPGANVYIGLRGIFNMYDGKIGEANAVVTNDADYNCGGSIALYGSYSQMNMYDGVIADGKITCEESGNATGGNIGAYRGALCIYGGTVRNGQACGNGGNIAVSDGATELHLENVIVSGGNADKFGGNVYIGGTATLVVELKNAIISDGNAKVAGGNIYTAYDCVIESCTITGGNSSNELGGGLTIEGKAEVIVVLKGDSIFGNNYGSDILLRNGDTGISRLSVAGITGTDEIVIAGSMLAGKHIISSDTHPNITAIFKAASGFTLKTINGLLQIYKD